MASVHGRAKHLGDYLLADTARPAVVADCASVIERHIADHRGFRGFGLRAGLAVVNAAKPQIVPRGVNWLLPEFAEALDPWFRKARRSHKPFADTVLEDRDEATAALLAVADRHAADLKSDLVKTVYKRLRGSAEEEVAAALPALVQALARHVPK